MSPCAYNWLHDFQSQLTRTEQERDLYRGVANDAISELSQYSAGIRDQSFEGWQKEWREKEVRFESDYAYYPNHVTKEYIHELKERLAQGDKIRGEG